MGIKEEILEYLNLDDLQGDTLFIAENSGLDNIKKIITSCEGLTLTIQKVNMMDNLIIRYLFKKYNGRELTKKEEIRLSMDLNKSLPALRKLIRRAKEL